MSIRKWAISLVGFIALIAILPRGYATLLEELKSRVRAAQLTATVAVNRELILLYWDIGRLIVDRQEQEGWGGAVIEHLANDIHKAFPGIEGFSRTNLFRARAFYLAHFTGATKVPKAVGQLANQKVPQPVGQLVPCQLPAIFTELPWGHNIILLERIKESQERVWYAQQTVEYGWSRNVLATHIGSSPNMRCAT